MRWGGREGYIIAEEGIVVGVIMGKSVFAVALIVCSCGLASVTCGEERQAGVRRS